MCYICIYFSLLIFKSMKSKRETRLDQITRFSRQSDKMRELQDRFFKGSNFLNRPSVKECRAVELQYDLQKSKVDLIIEANEKQLDVAQNIVLLCINLMPEDDENPDLPKLIKDVIYLKKTAQRYITYYECEQ